MRKIKNIASVTALLLLFALAPLPYGYYTFLRIFASIAFFYLTLHEYKRGGKKMVLLFLALTILFQPLLPIFLTKGIWMVIDVLVAIFLFIYANNKSYWS